MNATSNTVPFAWQDKRCLRMIREKCEEYRTALAVYYALTVIASDQEKNEFHTTHAWIAQMAGLSERTVRRRLEDLKRVGIIRISTPRLKAPSTYTLLAIGHDGRTLGNEVRTLGQGMGTSVAGIRIKGNNNNNGEASRSEITLEWLKGFSGDPGYKGIDIEVELSRAKRWCVEHPGRKLTRRFFLGWLNRCRPTLPEVPAKRLTEDQILKEAL